MSLPQVAAQDMALVDATVLNPENETVTTGVLVIRDGRIVELANALPDAFPGQVLDLQGRVVMPALADLHTHSFGNNSPAGVPQVLGWQGTANVALFSGVAFILDLFSPEEPILAFRDQQRAARPHQGALLFAAGPCFTATNGHCSEYGIPTRIVNTPDEARHEVADLATARPDVIKVVYDHQTYSGRTSPTVDFKTLSATLDEARNHDLNTVVHIGTWEDVRDAVRAGATAVTHTPGPETPPAGLAQEMVQAGTFHIPTLAVQSDFSRFQDDPALLDDPLMIQTVPEAIRKAHGASPENPRIVSWLAWQKGQSASNLASVVELAAAGVPILAGTDGGNFGVFQGYSIHRELQLLALAGVDRWEVLRSATTNAARFLDRRWGVSPGDEATLLVLDGSPLEEIANTKRIHAVIQSGVLVDREALRTWSK